MSDHPGLVSCAGCGGGIWPESTNFPLCDSCAEKAAAEPPKKARKK